MGNPSYMKWLYRQTLLTRTLASYGPPSPILTLFLHSGDLSVSSRSLVHPSSSVTARSLSKPSIGMAGSWSGIPVDTGLTGVLCESAVVRAGSVSAIPACGILTHTLAVLLANCGPSMDMALGLSTVRWLRSGRRRIRRSTVLVGLLASIICSNWSMDFFDSV